MNTKAKLIVNSIRWTGVILGLLCGAAEPIFGLIVGALLFGFAHLIAILATPSHDQTK